MEAERSRIRRRLMVRGIFRLMIQRETSIVQQVLQAYISNPTLHGLEMKVKFLVERGHDGGGLRRELVGCFWDEFSEKFMEGNIHKVPVLAPMQGVDYYHVGRFISHSYMLTGFFPTCLSHAFAKALTCGEESVTNEDLLTSFYNLVDPFEADILRECMSGSHTSDDTLQLTLVPLLSRFSCNKIPTSNDVKSIIPEVARFALRVRPFFALSEIRRGMLDAHPSFWKKCKNPNLTQSLCKLLIPTPEKVLGMIPEPEFHTMGQQTVFDYLRRYIRSLSSEDLGKLLRFMTGYSVCGPISICIEFNNVQGFERRPTANTCTPSLSLSVAYSSYSDFASEFNRLLMNSHLWFFDSI